MPTGGTVRRVIVQRMRFLQISSRTWCPTTGSAATRGASTCRRGRPCGRDSPPITACQRLSPLARRVPPTHCRTQSTDARSAAASWFSCDTSTHCNRRQRLKREVRSRDPRCAVLDCNALAWVIPRTARRSTPANAGHAAPPASRCVRHAPRRSRGSCTGSARAPPGR